MTDDKPARKKKNSTQDTSEKRDQKPADSFPVVGIGASAGGLQALEELFGSMSSETGMAFVIIIHLQPDQPSRMVELIQRYTDMPVHEITDGKPLKPNEVFVIPPAKIVGIEDNTLTLLPRPGGPRPNPIDLFFRSLAENRQENGIAVILSGAGSDGTAGARVIKEKLGLVLVQEPESARHSGMPESIIATGAPDRVMPAGKMGNFLVKYMTEGGPGGRLEAQDMQATEDGLKKIFITLKKRAGHDFSAYKRSTILRRIDRRLAVLHLSDISDYADYVASHPAEAGALFRELLIGVTSFFRDSEAWQVIEDKVLPEIIKAKDDDHTIRVWMPGAGTGEEAYSLAILLHELLEKSDKHLNVQIFATDINDDAIDYARAGTYPHSIQTDVSDERLERYFEEKDDHYRIRREVREMLVFSVQNVIKDPPFTRIDMLTCRNLLIYLDANIQKRLLPLFHYSLRPDGYLWLGSSESVGEYTDLFKSIDRRWKVFQAKETVDDRHRFIDFPLAAGDPEERAVLTEHQKNQSGLAALTDRILTSEYQPPCAVIDAEGEIKHIHGRTGRFLEPAPGVATLNVFDMAREGLDFHLRALVRRARTKSEIARREYVKIKTNGDEVVLNLTVRPIQNADDSTPLYMVIFEEITELPGADEAGELTDDDRHDDREHLELELRHTRENLKATIEELEASNEELKSTNEEYQSTNEELKSANEELETSREELQSLNEELSTVNDELQQKIDEISEAHQEVQSFLNSLGNPTIFLDNDLRVKRFTTQARDLIPLTESDRGRPITDLNTNLTDDTLADDARQVRETMQYMEKQVRTKDGHWYLRRIIPYRSTNQHILGVVVNFINIDELHQKTSDLATARDNLANANLIVESLQQPLLLVDEDRRVVSTNSAFLETFNKKRAEVVGETLQAVIEPHGESKAFDEAIERITAAGERQETARVSFKMPGASSRELIVSARRTTANGEQPQYVLIQFGEVRD